MEDKIKSIVSNYTKIPVENITEQTTIDRTVVASSIILHRMYAKLGTEGIVVNDYTSVKTFGQLLSSINGNEVHLNGISNSISIEQSNDGNNIGIDIEEITSMPSANDFRQDEFYLQNFSSQEIAYCILQPSPFASFAGLFAAKEAIVKADNNFKNRPFNSIKIDHLPSGKPVFNGFEISISHTNNQAIAVAVKNTLLNNAGTNATSSNSNFTSLLSFLSLICSLIVLLIALYKHC